MQPWHHRLATKALKPAALAVLALALWATFHNARKHGTDDALYYYKVGTLVSGVPLPEHPGIRRVVDSVPPRNYAPHEGVNLPYLDFPFEYPPVPIALFTAPRSIAPRYADYVLAYGAQMLLFTMAAGWLLWRLRRQLPGQPDGWTTLLLWAAFTLCTSHFIVKRFDVAISLLVVAALFAWSRALYAVAGLCLGLGIATKLWPAILVPCFALPLLLDRDWQKTLTLGAATLTGFLLPHLPFLLLGGGSAFSYLGYHGARGLQIESVLGNLALIVSKLFDLGATIEINFGAAHLASAGGWTSALVPLSYLIMVVAYGAVLLLAGRRFSRTGQSTAARTRLLTATVVAVTAALLVTSKVFSAQFVLWLFPLALLMPDQRVQLSALAAAALTGIEYPYVYFDYVAENRWSGLLLVLVRNLAVVAVGWFALTALTALTRDAESDRAPAASA